MVRSTRSSLKKITLVYDSRQKIGPFSIIGKHQMHPFSAKNKSKMLKQELGVLKSLKKVQKLAPLQFRYIKTQPFSGKDAIELPGVVSKSFQERGKMGSFFILAISIRATFTKKRDQITEIGNWVY